ncbi:hypothetical protein [Amycolatopsis taiwanensis]|uniref:hypothetical protein n=1 Tax=Amycolatopsis taiwanensis TaxID=342230 RepID=UPI000489A548|nr:hypothetical protein [Amycolatopsis taiwanensis]
MEFFRGERPWPQLYRLIERLPDHGHYKVAIRDDDEIARRQRDAELARPQPATPRSVDAHTWTPERAALTDIADILLTIRASLDAQRTGKPQKPGQMPRPKLARDRLEASESYQRHRQRVQMMLARG